MFTKSAAFYDAIYGEKDYAHESQIVHDLIGQHKRSDGSTLLDVACGTGRHITFLQPFYAIWGLDIEPGLLAIARQRCPAVTFVQGDMLDFDLNRQFDVVTCLFSAIGYVETRDRMCQAIQNMARHVKAGGVLIVEPWFAPEDWHPGHPHATFVDQPDLKIARMTVSEQEGRISRNDMFYLVATPEGVSHFTERHDLGLFTHQEYLDAFNRCHLKSVICDPDGLTGRGLYIGLS
jgi:ubiquinone/menaquinone biosynthesis C-methylase UbiE